MKRVLIGLIFSCIFISACSKNMDVKNEGEQPVGSEQDLTEGTSVNENITEHTSERATQSDAYTASIDFSDVNVQRITELQNKADEEADKDRYNIIEAMRNKESDERWGNAVGFIKKQYPDYFSCKELLENSIFYGRYMESLYSDFSKENNGRSRYYEMGKIVSDTAEEIYLGKKDVSDTEVSEQLDQLEVLLQFFYDKYYGKNSNY